MKTNDNIVLELLKIKKASHETVEDYLDQFTDHVEKLDTILHNSIQTSWFKQGLLSSMTQGMIYMQLKSIEETVKATLQNKIK